MFDINQHCPKGYEVIDYGLMENDELFWNELTDKAQVLEAGITPALSKVFKLKKLPWKPAIGDVVYTVARGSQGFSWQRITLHANGLSWDQVGSGTILESREEAAQLAEELNAVLAKFKK